MCIRDSFQAKNLKARTYIATQDKKIANKFKNEELVFKTNTNGYAIARFIGIDNIMAFRIAVSFLLIKIPQVHCKFILI